MQCMVSLFVSTYGSSAHSLHTADVEPEEVELGYDTQENLAFDADDDMNQREEPEEPETEDDAEQKLDDELGLDDDTDSM